LEIDTLRFGKIQVEEESVIRFSHGLPGFEQYNQYCLLTPDPNVPISYLQCVNDGQISFMVVEPFLAMPDYEFELHENVKHELQIYAESDVLILSIVTVKEDLSQSTINLKAPLIMNTKLKMGRQIILHDKDYSTKHPLFPTTTAQAAAAKGE